MKLVFIMFLLHLILPFIGLFNYKGYAGEVKSNLIILNGLYLFLEILIISVALFPLFRKERYVDISVYKFSIKKLYFYSIWILITIFLINLFVFGNYKILIGEMSRGEFRTTLHFGFIYNFFVLYVTGVILALNSYIYANLPVSVRRKYRKKILSLFMLGLLIGFATGYKATPIMIMIMGLSGMSRIIRIKHLIVLSLIFISLMAISGYLFMNFKDFSQVLKYLFIRATSLTAESNIAIYNLFPTGAPDGYMILLYALGNRLASFVSGYSVESVDYLQINLGRHIAYLIYPNYDKAISGAFNLTTTGFGEAIYIFGEFFLIYLLIVSFIISLLAHLYYRSKIALKITILVYFFTSIVLGGGKITSMLALTTFVYLLGVYLLVKGVLLLSKDNHHKIIL